MKKKSSFIYFLVIACICFCLPSIKAYAAKVNLTSAQIQKHFNGKVNSSYPTGKCLAFVADNFAALGAGRSSTCCAYNYGNSHIQSVSITNIPIGADVFFGDCGGGPCRSCGSTYYGHIGVYVGNNEFVHATGGRVQKSKLAGSNWAKKYRGWGYHGNITVAGSSLDNTSCETVPAAPLEIKPTISGVTIDSIDFDHITLHFSAANSKLAKIVVVSKATGQVILSNSYSSNLNCVSFTFYTSTMPDKEYYIRLYAYSDASGANETLHNVTYGSTAGVVKMPAKPLRAQIDYSPAQLITQDSVIGWVISETNIKKITVQINQNTYQVTNRYKRSDVGKFYPLYDISKAGFSYDILPTQVINGCNHMIIRAYTDEKTSFVIYETNFDAVKLSEGYFDAAWFYFKYHTVDEKVKKIGYNPKKLQEYYYTSNAISKGYSPNICFDPKYYLMLNPDVAKEFPTYKDAYLHFVKYALPLNEKRRTSCFLDLDFYQKNNKNNSEIKAMTAEQLFWHYFNYGSWEGRLGADTSEAKAFCRMFEGAAEYAKHPANSDLLKTFGTGKTKESANKLWEHFFVNVLSGTERRIISNHFSYQYYMEKYHISTTWDAFFRYINSGYKNNETTYWPAYEEVLPKVPVVDIAVDNIVEEEQEQHVTVNEEDERKETEKPESILEPEEIKKQEESETIKESEKPKKPETIEEPNESEKPEETETIKEPEKPEETEKPEKTEEIKETELESEFSTEIKQQEESREAEKIKNIKKASKVSSKKKTLQNSFKIKIGKKNGNKNVNKLRLNVKSKIVLSVIFPNNKKIKLLRLNKKQKKIAKVKLRNKKLIITGKSKGTILIYLKCKKTVKKIKLVVK